MNSCCRPCGPTSRRQEQQQQQGCKGALDPFCLRLPNPAQRCYFNPFVHSQCLGVNMNMDGLQQEIRDFQVEYKRKVWDILRKHTVEDEAAANESPRSSQNISVAALNSFNPNCCPNQPGCKGALDPFCLKPPKFPKSPCNFNPFYHAQCLGINLNSGAIRQEIQQCQEEYRLKVWGALRKYTVGEPCIEELSDEEQSVKEN